MKKIISVMLLAGFLAGCQEVNPDLIVTAPKVVVPPASLMVCNVPALPDKFNTNKDVATLLNKVYNSNIKCKNNMDGIKAFFVSARKTIH